MKNKFSGIAVVLVTMLLSSCRCDVQKVVYPTGDDMQAYVFRDTSVWIYENTTTNVRDTMVMYRMGHGDFRMDTNDNCVKLSKEIFVMDFKSSLKPYPPITYFVDYTGIRLDGTGVFPYMGLQIYNRLQTVGDSTSFSKYTSFHPTLSVGGQTYQNVKRIQLHYYLTSVSDTFYYWAPNSGLIRKEFHDSMGGVEYWDLIETNLKNY